MARGGGLPREGIFAKRSQHLLCYQYGEEGWLPRSHVINPLQQRPLRVVGTADLDRRPATIPNSKNRAPHPRSYSNADGTRTAEFLLPYVGSRCGTQVLRTL